jgi:hypothetical protein
MDLDGSTALGNKEPIAIVHNVNAINPLPFKFLPADNEYLAHMNGEEITIDRIPT